jgi:uncharacterized membrane protein
MGKQTLVRVNKIESYRDLNGSLGKKIELVEENEDHSNALVPEEVQAVISSVKTVLAQMGPQIQLTKPVMPKMILFLTEDEYDDLDVSLDVNQTYQILFEGQAIKFNKEYEQYIGKPITPPPKPVKQNEEP